MPISPNMGLNIPVVSTTPGPQYAQDVNASLNKLDVHNHTSGQGNQIPTAGLNINASLPMNNYGLLNTSQVSLTSQALPPITGSVYRNSADLYYVDGNGNNVRITQGGAVAVSGAVGFSGLPFGTAGASYDNLTQTFVFQSATNTAANVDCGSVILRELVAGAKGVTLSSPLALAADYTIRMPSGLPLATKIMQFSAGGDISAALGVDNSTIEISANNLQVKDLGITTAKLANLSVDSTKLASNSVTTAKITNVNVTEPKVAQFPFLKLNLNNLYNPFVIGGYRSLANGTFTTSTARNLMMVISGTGSGWGVFTNGGNFNFKVVITSSFGTHYDGYFQNGVNFFIPLGTSGSDSTQFVQMISLPGAATYTVDIQANAPTQNLTVSVLNYQLFCQVLA